MVADKDGESVLHALGMQGTQRAEKIGWRADTVNPGDRVTLLMHPLISASHGG
jgi:hypothetical protein